MQRTIAIRFCPPTPVWGSQRTFAEEFLPRLLSHLPNPHVYSSLSSLRDFPGPIRPAKNPLGHPGIFRLLRALLHYHFTFSRELSAAGAGVLFCPFNNEGVAVPRDIRQVLIVHDLVPLLFPRNYLLSRMLWATFYRGAIRRAHHIICVSQATRADLIRLLKINPARVSVVYNGFTPPLQVLPRAPRAQILYVASAHSPHKNIGRLLVAFAESTLRQTHQLRIVGVPHHRTTPKLKAYIREAGLDGRVHFLSRISNELLELEYASAEMLVYPSLCEGFGLPLLEAMARGVPVCAAQGSAVSEIGGDAAIYFDPLNPGHIGWTMEKLSNDASLRADLVARGLTRVKEFSWEKSAAQCAAICLKAAVD